MFGPDWPLRCIEPLGRRALGGREPRVRPVLTPARRAPESRRCRRTSPRRWHDPERYQTTYARALGSAAAPTAGLHFTPALDAALAAAGVSCGERDAARGPRHVQAAADGAWMRRRCTARRSSVEAAVWARLLRGAPGRPPHHRRRHHVHARAGAPGAQGRAGRAPSAPLRGDTRLFIRPGFEFRMVDALVTNFHLPRTSLLALVMAFCGVDETRDDLPPRRGASATASTASATPCWRCERAPERCERRSGAAARRQRRR